MAHRAEVGESETELITKAQDAVSKSNWIVGECAHRWTEKYARGRTDADFAAMIGLSPDQVYQRRRVWQTFADVRETYPVLRWSHFYAALTWDDAPESLQWANETQSTVAEMKAWRRAIRGEDLTVDADPDQWAEMSYVASADVAVKDPEALGKGNRREREGRSDERSETIAGVAREADGGEYSPFRRGAGAPAPREGSESAPAKSPAKLTPVQLMGRAAGALERINAALTPEMLKELKTIPEKQRGRFLKAVSELSAKAARLM